ncbi:protein lifeguard 1 [Brachyhypopomus gauderio]|uniref:protein lifeguard 1 n=1 Tax=Brachyhypopomus gauderio TaxID=698409 RepID=UPI00404200C5
MTDSQKQLTQEVKSDPSMYDPPPYPVGDTQTQPPALYMPPSYPYGPAFHPAYPPVHAGTDSGNPPAPAYSLYQGGYTTDTPPPEIMPVPNPGIENPEAGTFLAASSFDDDIVRRAFIRKVFSVVTLQLLFTFSVVCVFTFSETVKSAVQKNLWIYVSSYIVFAVVTICLSFSSSFSRSYPWNMIGLSVVTMSLSYMVGTVASFHNTTAVVIAMGATLAISFTIIIFSSQTRVDFTICNGILLILAMDLLMFGFFSIFYYSQALQILYGCLGALLYALFLAIDCQLVMGREKYGLSPEEYVFAALIIYMDIITIFLYILILLGGSSNN